MQIFTTPLVAQSGGMQTFSHGLSGKPDVIYAVLVASNGQLLGATNPHVIENQNDEITWWDSSRFVGGALPFAAVVTTPTQVIVYSEFWQSALAASLVFWVQNANATDDAPTAATIPNAFLKVYCIKF